MSVNNININNKTLIQAALNKKTAKAPTTIKNPTTLAMSKQGSIFNLVSSNNKKTSVNPKSDLTNLNTLKSLDDLKKPSTSSASSKSKNNLSDIDNASDGQAAIRKGKDMQAQVKSYTSETQSAQQKVTKYGTEGKLLQAEIIKIDKTFASQLKAQQTAIQKDNEKIERLIQENEETQQEVENAQRELDSLLASNSFSTKNGKSSGGNQEKINELQTLIGSKVGLIQNNGKTIYSLQRSSSRSISKMNRTNSQYVNTQKTNQKNIQSNQNETSGVIKVAGEIEKYSALASMSGQAIKIAGEALMALGSGTSILSFGATSALIAVGKVMMQVGTVLNLAGQYGQTAANLTKTAAYAAEGNLTAAMQSTVAAITTGAAAVKSTQTLKSDFDSINQQATETGQKAAANAEAKEQIKGLQEDAVKEKAKELGVSVDDLTKEQVKQAKSDAIGGVSVKDARKAVSAKLQAEMKANTDTFTTRRNKAFEARDNKTKLSQKYGDTASKMDFKKEVTTFQNKSSASKSSTTDWGSRLEQMGKGLQMAAATFGQMGGGGMSGMGGMNNMMYNPYRSDYTLDINGKKDKRYSRSYYQQKIRDRRSK